MSRSETIYVLTHIEIYEAIFCRQQGGPESRIPEHVYRETFNKDISGYVKNLDNGESRSSLRK